MKSFLVVLTFLIASGGVVRGEIVTRDHVYKDGDAVMEGYFAYDDALPGKRPVF